MKRKPPCLHSIGIDLNAQALSKFSCHYPVELVNTCAHNFLKTYTYLGSELIYCDPPYLQSTRTSNRKYRFDYNENDHIELLHILKDLPCKVMISGYASILYDNLLQGWQSIEIQVMNQGGVRTEKLWFNFISERRHWAKYAGKNFTDRQRIKRKAERWGRMYREMPLGERIAVMAAIMDIERKEASSKG